MVLNHLENNLRLNLLELINVLLKFFLMNFKSLSLLVLIINLKLLFAQNGLNFSQDLLMGKEDSKLFSNSIGLLSETAAAFEKMGAAHHRVDTSRNAAMHETDTIDYIILLKGDVTLILDEEEIKVNPHDIVVQRGTNHAWVNNGTEPALLIAVLIDSSLV